MGKSNFYSFLLLHITWFCTPILTTYLAIRFNQKNYACAIKSQRNNLVIALCSKVRLAAVTQQQHGCDFCSQCSNRRAKDRLATHCCAKKLKNFNPLPRVVLTKFVAVNLHVWKWTTGCHRPAYYSKQPLAANNTISSGLRVSLNFPMHWEVTLSPFKICASSAPSNILQQWWLFYS